MPVHRDFFCSQSPFPWSTGQSGGSCRVDLKLRIFFKRQLCPSRTAMCTCHDLSIVPGTGSRSLGLLFLKTSNGPLLVVIVPGLGSAIPYENSYQQYRGSLQVGPSGVRISPTRSTEKSGIPVLQKARRCAPLNAVLHYNQLGKQPGVDFCRLAEACTIILMLKGEINVQENCNVYFRAGFGFCFFGRTGYSPNS